MNKRRLTITWLPGALLVLIFGTWNPARAVAQTPGEEVQGQGFTLRVFFLGLMAFVPRDDGQRMTVLLIDARDGFEASDGTPIPRHEPLLVARAAGCRGDCRDEAPEIADYLYQGAPRPDPEENRRQLRAALHDGGCWQLAGHEISIRTRTPGGGEPSELTIVRGQRHSGRRLPRNAFEREDFGWMARIRDFAPEAAELRPEALAARPPEGLVVARLTLTAGTVKSHRLVSKEGKVRCLAFRPLTADSSTSDCKALTEQVVADISIPECEVTLAAERFEDRSTTKTMTLTPARCDGSGVVEVALVNLGEDSFKPPADADAKHHAEQVGSHFEIYYWLSKTPPARGRQPVPFLVDPEGELPKVESVAPAAEENSELLPVLGLRYDKGTYSRPICPVVEF